MDMSCHALWWSVSWRSCGVDVCIIMFHAFLSRWTTWLSGCKRTHLVSTQPYEHGQCVSDIHRTTPFLSSNFEDPEQKRKNAKHVEDWTSTALLWIPGCNPGLARTVADHFGGGRSWFKAMGRHAPRIQLTYESRTVRTSSRYGDTWGMWETQSQSYHLGMIYPLVN